MNNKMKSLYDQEEYIIITLNNALHKLKIYEEQLGTVHKDKLSPESMKDFKRFKRYFKFYRNHLIPAIQEMVLMDRRHLKLVKKNPDPAFMPILEEFNFHKKIVHKFINRFDEVHSEFLSFLRRTK